MPRCRRRLRTARPEGGEVRQSPETFGNGRRRLLRRGAAAGSPCPAAARREVSAAPCPLGKGAMLADSLVEEFEIREDEPWYDQQDLQQGERRGARREGGRGSAGEGVRGGGSGSRSRGGADLGVAREGLRPPEGRGAAAERGAPEGGRWGPPVPAPRGRLCLTERRLQPWPGPCQQRGGSRVFSRRGMAG